MNRPTEMAMYCLETMKGYGTYHGEKIGVIRSNFHGITDYKKGDVVIFKKDTYSSGTVTVEKPMCKEAISEQKSRGSLLTTMATTVCVPRHLVVEVKHPKIKAFLESIVG